MLIKRRRGWELPDSAATPEPLFQERRRLILAHREMPLSPMDVNAYKLLTDSGAIVCPANPGYYLNPTTVGEVVDFVAGKLLDLVGVRHAFDTRWDPGAPRPPMKYDALTTATTGKAARR